MLRRGLLGPQRRKGTKLKIRVCALMVKEQGKFYNIKIAAMIITKMITIYCQMSTKYFFRKTKALKPTTPQIVDQIKQIEKYISRIPG